MANLINIFNEQKHDKCIKKSIHLYISFITCLWQRDGKLPLMAFSAAHFINISSSGTTTAIVHVWNWSELYPCTFIKLIKIISKHILRRGWWPVINVMLLRNHYLIITLVKNSEIHRLRIEQYLNQDWNKYWILRKLSINLVTNKSQVNIFHSTNIS